MMTMNPPPPEGLLSRRGRQRSSSSSLSVGGLGSCDGGGDGDDDGGDSRARAGSWTNSAAAAASGGGVMGRSISFRDVSLTVGEGGSGSHGLVASESYASLLANADRGDDDRSDRGGDDDDGSTARDDVSYHSMPGAVLTPPPSARTAGGGGGNGFRRARASTADAASGKLSSIGPWSTTPTAAVATSMAEAPPLPQQQGGWDAPKSAPPSRRTTLLVEEAKRGRDGDGPISPSAPLPRRMLQQQWQRENAPVTPASPLLPAPSWEDDDGDSDEGAGGSSPARPQQRQVSHPPPRSAPSLRRVLGGSVDVAAATTSTTEIPDGPLHIRAGSWAAAALAELPCAGPPPLPTPPSVSPAPEHGFDPPPIGNGVEVVVVEVEGFDSSAEWGGSATATIGSVSGVDSVGGASSVAGAADILDSPLRPLRELQLEQQQRERSPSLVPYRRLSSDSDRVPPPPLVGGMEDGSVSDVGGPDDENEENDGDDPDEIRSVGNIDKGWPRRSASIALAAASAAPIVRMAARAKRNISVDTMAAGGGSLPDDGGRGRFLGRGALPTVPGSPPGGEGTHKGGDSDCSEDGRGRGDGGSCDGSGDGDGDEDKFLGSSNDPFYSDERRRSDSPADGGGESYAGFEEPHDLLFDKKMASPDDGAPSSRSPLSAGGTSSSDGRTSAGSGGLRTRWGRVRKRRQQQQKGCNQLYDDGGNLVAPGTPVPSPLRDSLSAASSTPSVDANGAPGNLRRRLEIGGGTRSGSDSGGGGSGGDDSRTPPSASASAGSRAASSSPNSLPLSVSQQSGHGRLAAIADETDSDNLADIAATAAAARAAGGDSLHRRTAIAGGEDVVDDRHIVRQLIDYFRYRPLKKKILTITVILSVILVIIDFTTLGIIRGWMEGFLLWMQNHPAGGFFAFIAMFIVTTLVFIPPSILTFGAGFVFAKAFGLGPGVAAAVFASFLGASTGAVIAFFRARYMMRDLVKLFANKYPIVKAADLALKHKGFRIMLLLRLCPLIPFNALNYIGGITGVHWHQYTFALIGLLPFMITTVFLGATAGTVSSQKASKDEITNIVSITVGCVVSVLAVALIWYFARKELHDQIAAHQEMERSEHDDLEESMHSHNVDDSDMSMDASLGDSIEPITEELYQEEWYWLWT